MYKEGSDEPMSCYPPISRRVFICFYCIAHHVLPVFVLFCNYILLPLMRFQDVQQGCFSVSHTVMGTLFPALFSRLSVQYVLLF